MASALLVAAPNWCIKHSFPLGKISKHKWQQNLGWMHDEADIRRSKKRGFSPLSGEFSLQFLNRRFSCSIKGQGVMERRALSKHAKCILLSETYETSVAFQNRESSHLMEKLSDQQGLLVHMQDVARGPHLFNSLWCGKLRCCLRQPHKMRAPLQES
jgi:hypothetical protein